MSEELVLRLGQETLKTTALLSGPLLLAALVVGLLVSVFQAVTQINEATLAFLPKALALCVALALLGPYMLSTLSGYTHTLLDRMIAIGGS